MQSDEEENCSKHFEFGKYTYIHTDEETRVTTKVGKM